MGCARRGRLRGWRTGRQPEAEPARLRAENTRLLTEEKEWQLEREILRRAAAYFARLTAGKARGHGIGARLIGRAVGEAQRRGLHPVLDVVRSDTAPVAL